MERRHSIALVFGGLGDGEVVLDHPAETLLMPTTSRVISPTNVPAATNLRLAQSVASTRSGYKAYLASPSTRRIMGMAFAQFDDTSQDTCRVDTQKIYRNSGGVWTDISGAVTFTGGTNDPFVFAMCPRTGGPPGNQLLLTNGVDALYRYRGGAVNIAAVAGTPPTAVRSIASFLSRAWAFNVVSGGARHEHRVQWSVVGNSEDWTNLGSGFVDLDADPYPGAALVPLAGRLVAFKGNELGGAVWVGTPTGDVRSPLRWDPLNPGSDVGVLLPRSVLVINPGLVFFVGHDAFYLYDGARSLLPIAERSSRSIISRVSTAALRTAFAWYKPATHEVHVAIATGGATAPNETWVVDVYSRRIYGPYVYGHSITAATYATSSSPLIWDTIVDGTWDTISATSWDSWAAAAGPRSVLYGTANGDTFEDTGGEMDDAGTAITTTWLSPAITPDRLVRLARSGAAHELDARAVLTMRQVTIRYRDDGAWTPRVDVSTNGGSSWTTISTNTSVGTGSGRVLATTFDTELASTWHMVRVQRATGGRMALFSVEAELSFMGSDRSS